MKLIYCLMIILWPFMSPGQTVTPLHIGDTVPDITLTNVYNYPSSTIRLSDLKGKLVILDFWATWCSSCIAGFPHSDSLQREFNNKIQIFLVNSKQTGDNAAKIISFFKKREIRTGLTNHLPFITGDSLLDKYFPHTYIPHYIWIDKQGHFLAATSSVEINSRNIASALSGQDFSVHIKKDQTDLDRKNPPFWKGNGKAGDSLIYRTIVTGYTEGLHGIRRRINNKGLTTGVSLFNVTLLDLFKCAYENGKTPFLPNNRIIKEVNNPDAFSQSFYEDTLQYAHSYCYDITVPPSTEEEVNRYMREDLRRIFKIIAVKEKRSLKCIVLAASSHIQKAVAKRNTPQQLDLEKESLHKFIHDYPITYAVQLLNSYSPLPIIDESNLNANISIELPYDLTDTKALVQSLTNTGFDVKEEQRLIDVIVLKEISSLSK